MDVGAQLGQEREQPDRAGAGGASSGVGFRASSRSWSSDSNSGGQFYPSDNEVRAATIVAKIGSERRPAPHRGVRVSCGGNGCKGWAFLSGALLVRSVLAPGGESVVLGRWEGHTRRLMQYTPLAFMLIALAWSVARDQWPDVLRRFRHVSMVCWLVALVLSLLMGLFQKKPPVPRTEPEDEAW